MNSVQQLKRVRDRHRDLALRREPARDREQRALRRAHGARHHGIVVCLFLRDKAPLAGNSAMADAVDTTLFAR